MRLLVIALLPVLLCNCKKTDKPAPPATTTTPPVDTPATKHPDVLANNTNQPVKPYTIDGTTPIDSFTSYLIKKGNNFCENNTYAITQYTTLRFRAVFDSSCIYTTTLPANQQDINKLFGFADCASHHQTNSARFGWNWYNGALHIHAYCYAGGTRSYKELGTVPIGKTIDCTLQVLDNTYIFMLDGKADTMQRGCTSANATGYKLLPYFGGDEPAPHDVKIKIREM
jgi:hypothetical protein